MKENLCQQIGKLKKKEITKRIDQLDPKAIGFFELLDLIEILLIKSQFLENSKFIGSKSKSFLSCQKHATVQTFRLNSIQEEIDRIHFKIGLLIQKLRKFNPKVIGFNLSASHYNCCNPLKIFKLVHVSIKLNTSKHNQLKFANPKVLVLVEQKTF